MAGKDTVHRDKELERNKKSVKGYWPKLQQKEQENDYKRPVLQEYWARTRQKEQGDG